MVFKIHPIYLFCLQKVMKESEIRFTEEYIDSYKERHLIDGTISLIPNHTRNIASTSKSLLFICFRGKKIESKGSSLHEETHVFMVYDKKNWRIGIVVLQEFVDVDSPFLRWLKHFIEDNYGAWDDN
jgi:hypothetical protein